MKITAREEYGLRCLLQLARDGAEPKTGVTLSARQIAEREGLSLEYSAQILASLRRAELVVSHRGVHGGFGLARPAADTTVGELFRAFEGPFGETVCESYTGQLEVCAHAGGCDVAPVWRELSRRIYGFLDSLSLADVAAGAVQGDGTVLPASSIKQVDGTVLPTTTSIKRA